MRVGVRHVTRLTYSAPVSEELLETRLGPLSDADQRWERFELRVRPTGMLRPYVDGFGNSGYIVTLAGTHEFIELTAESVVTTLVSSPSARKEPARQLSPLERFDFLLASRLATIDPSVAELAEPHRLAVEEGAFAASQGLSHTIHGLLDYRPGMTDTGTTAVEALQGGGGVCQDFSHLLIAACRSVGIPARYVSGYLIDGDPAAGDETREGWRRLPPPGASHSWVETFSLDHGWRGLDPTHDTLVDDRYVKMAVGRDYADVPPTRGVFRGAAASELAVEVTTQPLD